CDRLAASVAGDTGGEQQLLHRALAVDGIQEPPLAIAEAQGLRIDPAQELRNRTHRWNEAVHVLRGKPSPDALRGERRERAHRGPPAPRAEACPRSAGRRTRAR